MKSSRKPKTMVLLASNKRASLFEGGGPSTLEITALTPLHQVQVQVQAQAQLPSPKYRTGTGPSMKDHPHKFSLQETHLR